MNPTPNDTTRDGHLVEIDGQHFLRFERRYDNAIDDVWDAITNPTRLAQWFLPFDAEISIDLRAGGDYELRGLGDAPTLHCTVLAVEPPHRFQHTHPAPGVVITWTLDGDADGTTLVMLQTVPDLDATLQANFVVGMHLSISRLDDLLDGHPSPWDWGLHDELQRRYAAAGLAAPLAE